MRRTRGFTLLEVLVAMAVAAIALIALFGAAASTARGTAVLKERTYAHLVAANALAELRAKATWPSGELHGEAEMADQRWEWTAQVRSTDDASIRRVEFVVRGPDGAQAATLIGFVGRPQASGSGR